MFYGPAGYVISSYLPSVVGLNRQLLLISTPSWQGACSAGSRLAAPQVAVSLVRS